MRLSRPLGCRGQTVLTLLARLGDRLELAVLMLSLHGSARKMGRRRLPKFGRVWLPVPGYAWARLLAATSAGRLDEAIRLNPIPVLTECIKRSYALIAMGQIR